jgi:preprotein translocase subunit SecY
MKFFETLKNAYKIEELRDRIALTLGLLLVYRFGAQVVLPGIDAAMLSDFAGRFDDGGIGGLLNAFTGGAFANASIFAQLMQIAVPYLQKLQKEGESGRKKINQITRWLTIGICLVQAPSYLAGLPALGVPSEAFVMGQSALFYISSITILVTGCVFAMWLGEKITDKGIGNGISILIMVGIIARLPLTFAQEFASRVFESNGGMIMILIELAIWFVIILLSILLVMAVRKIPVQYARRTASGAYEKNIFGARQFIPLKLNASGVMPIIFAQAIMFVPSAVASLSESAFAQTIQANFSDIFGFWYNLVFGVLIIIFTYFYTAITVPTNKMADDLKRSGGFIPGIKPGTETGEYLDRIMSQITLPGSVFLALIAIFPAFVVKIF